MKLPDNHYDSLIRFVYMGAMMGDMILEAMGCDAQGNVVTLSAQAVSAALHDDALAWVHLDATHPDTRTWLEREVSYLDGFVLNALLAGETRPMLNVIGEGVLMILRGVNLNDGEDPEDMVSIRIWADPHRIITLQRRPLKAVGDMARQMQSGYKVVGPADFLCLLIERLNERMQPVLLALDDALDVIEEDILDAPSPELRESIITLRRQAIMFRRYISPQREAIGQLRAAPPVWLNEVHGRHLQESHNHVTRYVEDLDALRERAQIVKDELANLLSDRMNKNMYILSVISAIFLPLGFLTGMLGVNVGGIPGAESPHGFRTFAGILMAIVAAQVLLFKKMRWF